MRFIYAVPNKIVVLTGLWEPTRILTHFNMLFLSPEGYIDLYPLDVGAFSFMKDPAVVIPFWW